MYRLVLYLTLASASALLLPCFCLSLSLSLSLSLWFWLSLLCPQVRSLSSICYTSYVLSSALPPELLSDHCRWSVSSWKLKVLFSRKERSLEAQILQRPSHAPWPTLRLLIWAIGILRRAASSQIKHFHFPSNHGTSGHGTYWSSAPPCIVHVIM